MHTEVRKTRETIKNCVKRTPRVRLPLREVAAPVAGGWQGNTADSAVANENNNNNNNNNRKKKEEEEEAGVVAAAAAVAEAAVEEEQHQQSPSAIPETEARPTKVAILEETPEPPPAAEVRAEPSPKATPAAPAAPVAPEVSLASTANKSPPPTTADAGSKQTAEAPAKRKTTAAKRNRRVGETAPATSYEFIRVWKSLGSEAAERRVAYVRLVGAKAFQKLFKTTGIETDLFVEIFHASLSAFMPKKPGQVLALLDGFTKCSRFSTTLMFMADDEKAKLHAQLQPIVDSGAAKFPKRVGRIRKAFKDILQG